MSTSMQTPLSKDDICWLIQGHTKYYLEVCEHFKGVDNVFWCLEDDSNPEHIKYIVDSGVDVITVNRVPPGYGRINIHSHSSKQGLQVVKNLNFKFCIKLRSDLVFSDANKFLDIVKNDGKIHGHCYVRHGGRFIDNPIATAGTYNWLSKFENIVNSCDQNYITDWIHYGPIDELLLFYGEVFLDDIDKPVICEVRFMTSYLVNKGLNIDFTYEYLTEVMPLFMMDLYEAGIDMLSLKEGMNYSKMWSSEEPKGLPDNFLG